MPETVLVVEDDEANALLIQTLLERLGGYQVVCSDDAEEIVRLVESGAVAAVLMDVSLTNTRLEGNAVDGVALTRHLRSLPSGRSLPILLLTAYAMRGDRETLLFSSGANDYVAKPIVDQQGFIDLLRRHIASSHIVESPQDEA